jgi:hypothetical protein
VRSGSHVHLAALRKGDCKQSRHSVIMEEWNGREHAFAIKMFYKTDDSLKAAQREFRRIFQFSEIDNLDCCFLIGKLQWFNYCQ